MQFSPQNRMYATGSTGGVVSWQLGPGAVTVAESTRTRMTDMDRMRPPAPILANKCGGGHLRFRRLSHPQRLSVPAHTPIHCAALKVRKYPCVSIDLKMVDLLSWLMSAVFFKHAQLTTFVSLMFS
ncbi:unnamed protein product [Echinostoma caproni]|uniref:WD_REPEATS_REGION domain-containing protein n=1 Tax=Echinostoma caproni TaxID=27848 RepID=A0A3P8D7G0_9TREM|nr:unnamed protein product [Echinostoma caproni]